MLTWWLLQVVSGCVWADFALQAILIFFCLAGTTLIREVKMVFKAVDKSLDAGRLQVGRIVGARHGVAVGLRDTHCGA